MSHQRRRGPKRLPACPKTKPPRTKEASDVPMLEMLKMDVARIPATPTARRTEFPVSVELRGGALVSLLDWVLGDVWFISELCG